MTAKMLEAINRYTEILRMWRDDYGSQRSLVVYERIAARVGCCMGTVKKVLRNPTCYGKSLSMQPSATKMR
jgi:hypothetical protein